MRTICTLSLSSIFFISIIDSVCILIFHSRIDQKLLATLLSNVSGKLLSCFCFILLVILFSYLFGLQKPLPKSHKNLVMVVISGLAGSFLFLDYNPVKNPFQKETDWQRFLVSARSYFVQMPELPSLHRMIMKDSNPENIQQQDLFVNSHFFSINTNKFQSTDFWKLFSNSIPTGQNKVWSHRGLNTGQKGNSFKAIQETISMGFKGIELDVSMDKSNGLFLSHDEIGNENSSKLIAINDLLKIPNFSELSYLWLDIKELDFQKTEIIANKLNGLLEKFPASLTCFIEHPDPFFLQRLTLLSKAHKIWGVSYGLPYFTLSPEKVRALAGFAGASAISLRWEIVNEEVFAQLPNIPILAYTCNNIEKLKKLKDFKNVFAILTDIKDFSGLLK